MNIKLSSTNKELSSHGGLIIDNDIFSRITLKQDLEPILPQKKIKTKTSSVDKFKALMFALITGAECLDDMNDLAHDFGFTSINDNTVNSSNTYGDYLRSFTHLQCKELNELLIKTSLKLRNMILSKEKEFILDIDSFSSVQTGKKIEGVEFNYNNQWCLDTLAAFDQFGFPYYLDVRKGATHTSVGACSAIHMIFKNVSKKVNKYLRADSGYCNMDVFNACNAANAKFVIKLRQDIATAHIHKCKNWKLSKKIKFKDGRECELAETIYYPSKSHRALRIVYIRALRANYQTPLIWSYDCYDYTAWVTNMGSHEMTGENTILFYRGRGNAENYIKELKVGLI